MLTNKDIIEALVNVGYTLKEISKFSSIGMADIRKMKKNEQVDEKVDALINTFFRVNMETVSVSEFGDEKFKEEHLILTPNGFKKVEEYKEEGLQHCFELKFDGFNTIVTDKHNFQNDNGDWITADKVKVGDKIKVFDDACEVKAVNEVGDINCCSLTVEDGEYYLDGVLSK